MWTRGRWTGVAGRPSCGHRGISAAASDTTQEDSMDPTMHAVARSVRSVQRAVMSAPTTTITDAAETARRAARSVAASLDAVSGGAQLRAAGAGAA
jgi:hypothetical protein